MAATDFPHVAYAPALDRCVKAICGDRIWWTTAIDMSDSDALVIRDVSSIKAWIAGREFPYAIEFPRRGISS